jgi:hypothetical protein
MNTFQALLEVEWRARIEWLDISRDNGKNWAVAKLGENFGRFTFRLFSFETNALPKGNHKFLVRARNKKLNPRRRKLLPIWSVIIATPFRN